MPKNLHEIWNLDSKEFKSLLSKKDYKNKSLMYKRITFSTLYKEKLNSFDLRIVNNDNFLDLKNKEENLNLLETIKLLKIKFSFEDLDSCDKDTLLYLYSSKFSNINISFNNLEELNIEDLYEEYLLKRNKTIKLEVSIILNELGLMKDKYINIFNSKHYTRVILESISLKKGYKTLKELTKIVKCKFNEVDDQGKILDPITREILEEDNIEMNGRCYNRSTIENILKTTKKDPFTREGISEEIWKMFSHISKDDDDDDEEEEDDDEEDVVNLDLSGENLTEMPTNFGYDITRLYLYNNQISKIPENWDSKNINELYLSNNRIAEIPEGWDSKNIDQLDLSNNKITEIPKEWDSKKIIYLDLSNNKITEIPEKWDSKNIDQLYLNNNKITKIPEKWDSKNIDQLYLSNNKISNENQMKIKNRFPNVEIIF